MPYKTARRTALCVNCPFEGTTRNKCWGYSDSEKPNIIFLGEAPGEKEEQLGIPFVGPSGYMLKSAVDSLGKKFHQAHRTNVICCRPPKNNIGTLEAQHAMECCRPGMLTELRNLRKKGITTIVAVGDTAMKALNIKGTISKSRGSIYMIRLNKEAIEVVDNPPYDFLCVPTFHPSFLMRGQLKHEVSFSNDIEKAYTLSENPYKPPEERFLIFPTIEEIEKWTKEILKRKSLIGVDIETTGLVPGKARILMVGIATTEEDAFVIPFAKQGGLDYWQKPAHRMRAHEALKQLMAKAPTVFQNCLFDMRHLKHFGTPVLNLKHDTMLLHHVISAELPHNLGYIVSVYGKTPYWKDEVLASPDKMAEMPDEVVRTYNLRDSVTLLQVLPELIKDAKESGTYSVYENISMPLVNPVMSIMGEGIKVDKKALEKWKKYLKTELSKTTRELYELAELPASFNFASGDHLRKLFYGQKPARYEKMREALAQYEQNPKLSKNTKKYKGLAEDYALFNEIKPFPNLRFTIKKTETGQLSVDDEAILNMQVAANNRIQAIGQLKKPTAAHDLELKRLNKVIAFIDKYRYYAELQKLDTTYTYFPMGEDSRVRFPYRISGTYSGRFSSGDKKAGEAGNAQNLPKVVKHIFVAEDGNVLLQADYSNLELRVLAEVSNDTVLKDIFKEGRKVHRENCKLLFGLEESDPMWEAAYRACKTYIFGRNYGGGLMGIHRRIVQAVPELNLTYDKFCKIDSAYREAHPAYEKWRNDTIKQVETERCLTNLFGRKRYFLGSSAEIIREGLNFPIQSVAADVLNFSLIRIQNAIDRGELKSIMVATVHDSILFEVPKARLKREAKKIKELMEEPVKVGKRRTVVFPIDLETGDTWGTLKEYSV